MAIEINSLFSGISSGASSIKALRTIFSSVLYTSLLLAATVLIIIMLVVPVRKGTPGSILFKVFFYVAATTMLALATHNSFVRAGYKNKFARLDNDAFIESIRNDGAVIPERVDVRPEITEGAAPRPAVGGRTGTPEFESAGDMLDYLESLN